MMSMDVAPYCWAMACAGAVLVLVLELELRHVPLWLVSWLAVGGLALAGLTGGMPRFLDHALAMAALALPGACVLRFANGGPGRSLLVAVLGGTLGWRDGLLVLGCLCAVQLVHALLAARLQLRPQPAMQVVAQATTPLPHSAATPLRKWAAEVDNSSRASVVPAGAVILAGLCVAFAMSVAVPTFCLALAR